MPEGLVHALERFQRFYHYYSRKASEMFVDITIKSLVIYKVIISRLL